MQLLSLAHARARAGALPFSKMLDPSLSLKLNDVVDDVQQQVSFF